MLSKQLVSSYHSLIEAVLWIAIIAGGSIGGYIGYLYGGLVGLLIGGGFGIMVLYAGLAIFAGAALVLGDIRESLLRIEKVLEKKELKSLNVMMGKSHPEQAVVTTPHESAPSSSKQMEEYNITFDGERYAYGEYKYEKLSDAISYAKQQRK